MKKLAQPLGLAIEIRGWQHVQSSAKNTLPPIQRQGLMCEVFYVKICTFTNVFATKYIQPKDGEQPVSC
jgi:hypothetical protein